MVVDINKCCINAICWILPCLIYYGITMACVKRHKLEMFVNVVASGIYENQFRAWKNIPVIHQKLCVKKT